MTPASLLKKSNKKAVNVQEQSAVNFIVQTNTKVENITMRISHKLKFITLAGMTSFVMACSSNPKLEEPAPAPIVIQKAEAPVEIVETARGPSVTLDDVQFDFEQSSLRQEAVVIITKAAAYLRDNPNRYALVEGHTDTSGDPSFNQYLSLERSKAVESALIAAGVSEYRIRTRGLGDTRPVADNSTLSGRQANRRVEIIFSEIGTQL